MPRPQAVDTLKTLIPREHPSQARFAERLGTRSPVVGRWLEPGSRVRPSAFFRVVVEIVTRGKVPREWWDYPGETQKLERLAKRYGYDLRKRKPLQNWKGEGASEAA